MVIKVYNNTIMAPVKCGSRFLDKVWEDERVEFIHYEFLKFPKVKYVVIRDPLSHLVSALHTETVGYINEFGRKDDFYHQLNDFISDGGATHWCVPFYEYLYYYKNRYGDDIKVIKLENLTDLLRSVGHDLEYVPEEYHFKKYEKWWTKDELFKILTEMYPKEIEWLLDKVNIQNKFYQKLINNEIDINSKGSLI